MINNTLGIELGVWKLDNTANPESVMSLDWAPVFSVLKGFVFLHNTTYRSILKHDGFVTKCLINQLT